MRKRLFFLYELDVKRLDSLTAFAVRLSFFHFT